MQPKIILHITNYLCQSTNVTAGRKPQYPISLQITLLLKLLSKISFQKEGNAESWISF